MVPTEKGKILYNYIVEPIQKLEMAEQHFLKRSQSERPTISVGMCFETFQYTLEEHIPKLPFNLIIKFGEYPQMQHDLDNGLLDLIVTPQKGNQKNLLYEPFSTERIVLIAGGKTDLQPIESLLKSASIAELGAYLKEQLWYSTTADMEHMKNFWKKNFKEHPDFRPNYLVPNISSIIRCLSDGVGFSIVPDFLCREAIDQQKIKLVWEGTEPMDNTLYFGTRKNTMYQEQLNRLEMIFREKWEKVMS